MMKRDVGEKKNTSVMIATVNGGDVPEFFFPLAQED